MDCGLTPKRPVTEVRQRQRESNSTPKRGLVRIKNNKRQKWNGTQWRNMCQHRDTNGRPCNKETQNSTDYCSRHFSSLTRAGLVQEELSGTNGSTSSPGCHNYHYQQPQPQQQQTPQRHPPQQSRVASTSSHIEEDSQDSVSWANPPKLLKDRSFSHSSVSTTASSMSPGHEEWIAAEGLVSLRSSRTNTPYAPTPLQSSPELFGTSKKRLFARKPSQESIVPPADCDTLLDTASIYSSSVSAQAEGIDYDMHSPLMNEGEEESLVCRENCIVDDIPTQNVFPTLPPSLPTPNDSRPSELSHKSNTLLPQYCFEKVPRAKRRRIEADAEALHRSTSLPDLNSNIYMFVCVPPSSACQASYCRGQSVVVSPVNFTEARPRKRMHQPKVQTKELPPESTLADRQPREKAFHSPSCQQPLLKSQTSAFDVLQHDTTASSSSAATFQAAEGRFLSDGEGSSTNMMARLTLRPANIVSAVQTTPPITTPSTQDILTPPLSTPDIARCSNTNKHFFGPQESVAISQITGMMPTTPVGGMSQQPSPSSIHPGGVTNGRKPYINGGGHHKYARRRSKGRYVAAHGRKSPTSCSQPLTPPATAKKIQSCRTTWPQSKVSWCEGCKTKKHGCDRLKKEPQRPETALEFLPESSAYAE